RYMPLIFDAESLAAMRAVRRVWDSEERVNPGKVVPVHACREWTGVRSVEWGVRSVASRDAPADSALRTPHSALDTLASSTASGPCWGTTPWRSRAAPTRPREGRP